MITGAQIRAARAMLRWSPDQLASRSKLPSETIRQLEDVDGEAPMTKADENAVRSAFQAAGVEFTNRGGPGLRLKAQGPADEGLRPDQLTSENDG
jgi:hypothetical protein